LIGADPSVGLATAALRCACPRCGRGALFAGFLDVRERCPDCGLDLRRHDSGDGPAVFLIFLLGFLVVPPALIVSLRVDWPLWLHALVWSTVILGATVGLIRPVKALTVAIQYRYRRSELGPS
jgi:uncharacterized protein (DUF983 family)